MTKYSRQELYPEIGKEGQRKIRQAVIAVVGIGAIGTVAAELLCRAGVKKLVLIDRDMVEESNLQRQVLFEENDIGKAKALAAQEHLQRINADVNVEAHVVDLNFRNIEEIMKEVDIILDGSDNLETRYLINEYSLKYQKPWVYASAIQDKGFVAGFSGKCPCFQCIMNQSQAEGTCDTIGVLNSCTALIGSLQANECLKIILGKETGSLIHVQVMKNRFDVLTIKKNKKCTACKGGYDYLEGRRGESIIRFCRTGQFQITAKTPLDLEKLKSQLEKVGKVDDLSFCLVFQGMKIFKDRVLIPAKTEQEAKALYARYINQ